jgi:hypothetical protein
MVGLVSLPVKRPKCFSSDDFADWSFWNDRIAYQNEQATSPCQDCPAWFADEMRAIDNCDGRPGEGPQLAELTGGNYNDRRVRARQARQRRVMTLYNIGGLTQHEVATLTGLAPSTVSKYVNLARRGAA